jgi:Holliday junction resolvase RusA-like endonuclease
MIYESTKGHSTWRVTVTRMAMAAMREQGHELIEGAAVLSVKYRFPRPPSHVKVDGVSLRKGKPKEMISSPDLSKLVRCVEDALTDAKVWTDDSHVIRLLASKLYAKPGEAVGVEVTVAAVAE